MRSLFPFNLIISHPAFFQRISLQRFRLPIPLFQATCDIPCWEFSATDFSGLAFQFSALKFSVLGTPFRVLYNTHMQPSGPGQGQPGIHSENNAAK